MSENIFFDKSTLKHLGKNVIIGKSVRIRQPQFCSIGDDSIIDDFTYISTKLKMGLNSHIASNVTIGGGKDFTFVLGDLCGISAGVTIWCASDDYINDLIGTQDKQIKKMITGDVIMNNFTGIGANSVIMPNVVFSEGAAVGALSLIRPNTVLEPWMFYVGIPAKPIRKRNKEDILLQVKKLNYKSY